MYENPESAGVESALQPAELSDPYLRLALLSDEEPVAHDSASDWRVLVNAWIWPMGIEGDLGVRGVTTDVNANFLDILDATDSIIGLAGRIEIAKGRIGGFVDGLYNRLGVEDVTIERPDVDINANIDFDIDLGGGPFNPNPNPDPNPQLDLGLLPTEVDFTVELGVIDFGLSYRFCEWAMGGGDETNARRGAVDGYVGGRYTYLSMKIDPDDLPSRESDFDWIDPIVGLRVVLPFAENWELAIWGDVGGFGVSSDLTWSATGVIGYRFELFGAQAGAYGGYRAIGWDYEDGSGADKIVWDVTLHGPILGLSLFF